MGIRFSDRGFDRAEKRLEDEGMEVMYECAEAGRDEAKSRTRVGLRVCRDSAIVCNVGHRLPFLSRQEPAILRPAPTVPFSTRHFAHPLLFVGFHDCAVIQRKVDGLVFVYLITPPKLGI